jgi:hypothetical protein
MSPLVPFTPKPLRTVPFQGTAAEENRTVRVQVPSSYSFFFQDIGVELRVTCLLGRFFYHLSHAPTFFFFFFCLFFFI